MNIFHLFLVSLKLLVSIFGPVDVSVYLVYPYCEVKNCWLSIPFDNIETLCLALIG